MNYKAIILDEAKPDIVEVRAYYRKILKSLSKRFTSDVKSTVASIRNRPASFGFRFNKFRTANLSVFPFQIHYSIKEDNSTIIIFALLHPSRDPAFIIRRFR